MIFDKEIKRVMSRRSAKMRTQSLRKAVVVLSVSTITLLACGSTPALAAPAWEVFSTANPKVAPGGALAYSVYVQNVGDAPTDGTPVTLTARLPRGVVEASVENTSGWTCTSLTEASVVRCQAEASQDILAPNDMYTSPVWLDVVVSGDAKGTLTSVFEVAGGGSASATTLESTRVDDSPTEFGIDAFDTQTMADRQGTPLTQAAGHPYAFSTTLDFNTLTHPNPMTGPFMPAGPVKDIIVDMPPGFVGDPTISGDARCTVGDLAHTEPPADFLPKSLCAPASQVGVATVSLNRGLLYSPVPIFNMVPPPDAPARFAFSVLGTIIVLDAAVRNTDYGLTVRARNTPQGAGVAGTRLTFWGVPADATHDGERACPGVKPPWEWPAGPTCGTDAPERAFLRNPTSCAAEGVGLSTTVRIDSWHDVGNFVEASTVSHLLPGHPAAPEDWGPPQGPTGCDLVPFHPDLRAAPSGLAMRDRPAGYSFDLTLPQSDDPGAIGQSDLKKAVVTLPEGVRVSPSSADGLGACSASEIRLKSSDAPTCPNSSKIGEVTVETPLLDEPLTGSVYLATPHENPFHSLIAVYMVAKGPGVIVKLPGKVQADPVTGQLKATFDDNPQLPFSKLSVKFKDGPRAPLVNPATCGSHTTSAALTGWNGKTVISDSSFGISQDGRGGACPALGFAPGFTAGTTNPVAGASAPFTLRLTREDGKDQELRSLGVTMPQGLLGKLKGIRRCPEALAKVGTCRESSRIGSVLTGAGAGTNPLFLPGRVYLTDSYKGGAFGLSIVVPAVAGPFDLGTVVVRASIRVDRRTAQLSVVSDPLPEVLEGIRLQIRDIRVTIDRPSFVVNPTGCAEKRVSARVGSVEGAVANVGSRFQVADCAALAFKPRLALRLTGKRQITTGKHPGVKARVTQRGGEAGIARAVVELPKSLALDPANARRLCEFEDGTKDDLENHCPKGSIVGRARAVSPLLNRPLAGNVYFVKNVRRGRSGNAIRTLPMLVAALRGEIAINLRGESSTTGTGQLVNSFKGVPDAPIKRFDLNIRGGSNGILAVTRTAKSPIDLCAKPKRHVANVKMAGHNGKRRDFSARVKTPCATQAATLRAAAKRKVVARRR
jgi:hypothetical protein